MELPRRPRGDELLKPGELTDLRQRLCAKSSQHDLATVIACAFDHRTRLLPFLFTDTHMVPAGIRAVGSAMLDAGFDKTRIVLQQWNPNFRPSMMRLDGRIPDIFMVSSMQIHTAQCKALLRDAWRIDPAHRPLIIAGGPKVIYEPWDVFSADPQGPWGADVAVAGEEFVLLSLLDAILSIRANGEPMRNAFMRARDAGMLDEIPGLVYPHCNLDGAAEELVDTGVQRLLSDLDELPHPVLGYSILEPPSRKPNIGSDPVPADQIRGLSPISSLVLTYGCKFNCPYCPIPAYNQRQLRAKSGERIADEMTRLYSEYGMRNYFGADDNFFGDRRRALDILETLATKMIDGRKFRRYMRWGTEVTVHDTFEMREHLPLVRASGVRALWLGVEDMTGSLVQKGQTVSKTVEVFHRLQANGICPMPMMMHHDDQPLYTRTKEPRGLLNQVRILRKAGAISLQVLMITPATGSRLYEETYTSGMVYDRVGGRPLETYMLDGNYVAASQAPKPWRKQFNIMACYLYFYNPIRFFWALIKSKSKLYLADALYQLFGMWGLLYTARRTLGWAMRLRFCKITRKNKPPISDIPMRSPDGKWAAHAVPDTPFCGTVDESADEAESPDRREMSSAN